MIYLASPYTHPDERVRIARFEAACRAAAKLIGDGQPALAPIFQGHPLVCYGLPGYWSFWEPLAGSYLARCDEVLVLTLDGWCESEGVQAELALARLLRKRVDYLHPKEAQP